MDKQDSKHKTYGCFILLFMLGFVGCLMGYGIGGSLKSLCLGAGIGMILAIILVAITIIAED